MEELFAAAPGAAAQLMTIGALLLRRLLFQQWKGGLTVRGRVVWGLAVSMVGVALLALALLVGVRRACGGQGFLGPCQVRAGVPRGLALTEPHACRLRPG